MLDVHTGVANYHMFNCWFMFILYNNNSHRQISDIYLRSCAHQASQLKICDILREHCTRMCLFVLQMCNIAKTVLRGEGTENATVITKKQNFHHIIKRTLEQYHLYFVRYRNFKKSY